jgi:D-glycero-D-manno-heptose 1,7-bisphosphate phosphatase
MTEALRPAVFLDRDGVLNKTTVRDGITRSPDHLGQFEFLPGVPEAVQRLADAGFALVVVTNQPDVGRGLRRREDVEAIHDHLRSQLQLLDILVCYHDNGDNCVCRKPKPGMLLEAARRWPIDLRRSFMVGDRWSDVLAGQQAGCRTVLVETPYSSKERCVPDATVADLPEAADWILAVTDERGST